MEFCANHNQLFVYRPNSLNLLLDTGRLLDWGHTVTDLGTLDSAPFYTIVLKKTFPQPGRLEAVSLYARQAGSLTIGIYRPGEGDDWAFEMVGEAQIEVEHPGYNRVGHHRSPSFSNHHINLFLEQTFVYVCRSVVYLSLTLKCISSAMFWWIL